jgi:hypothetical protein
LTDDEGELMVFGGDDDNCGITPSDIKQGSLGDCYFLSSLSVIAEKPSRIKSLINTHEINDQGVYAVTLFKNGAKMQVMVDDHIVCKNAEPVFSKANGPELWVLIAEKAWAKIHGSFERIEGGMAHLTMRDLTGAPAYHHDFAKSAKEGMNLANEILKWDE